MTSKEPARFPWANAMQFGFGRLRLGSEQFWKLTPRELAAAHAAVTGRTEQTRPMDRATLDALHQRFPDKDQANG